jgi:hypothetical protein
MADRDAFTARDHPQDRAKRLNSLKSRVAKLEQALKDAGIPIPE